MRVANAGSRGLVVQLLSAAYSLVALFLLVVILRDVLPHAGDVFRQEPVRVLLIGPAFLIAAATAVWAWRRPNHPPAVWAVAALPGALILVLYAPPLGNDLSHPGGLLSFAIGVLVIGGSAVAILAAAAAALESVRGDRLGGPLGRRGGALSLLAVLALTVLGWGLVHATNSSSENGGAGGGSQAGGSSNPPGRANPLALPPSASGHTVVATVSGPAGALPPDPLAIGVVHYTAPAGSFSEHGIPGIEILQSGADKAAGRDLTPGAAAFLPGGDRDHALGAASSWYFVQVRGANQHGGLNGPGSQEVYATQPLPPLPHDGQLETATVNVLGPGGRTARVKSGGVELILCLEGTVTVTAGTLPGPVTLKPGQATSVLEGTPLQVSTTGGGSARYLAFFLAPQGTLVERPA